MLQILLLSVKPKKVLKKMKDEEKFVEKPFKNQGEAPQKSIDDLVNEDLAKFAKERGLPFEKNILIKRGKCYGIKSKRK